MSSHVPMVEKASFSKALAAFLRPSLPVAWGLLYKYEYAWPQKRPDAHAHAVARARPRVARSAVRGRIRSQASGAK